MRDFVSVFDTKSLKCSEQPIPQIAIGTSYAQGTRAGGCRLPGSGRSSCLRMLVPCKKRWSDLRGQDHGSLLSPVSVESPGHPRGCGAQGWACASRALGEARLEPTWKQSGEGHTWSQQMAACRTPGEDSPSSPPEQCLPGTTVLACGVGVLGTAGVGTIPTLHPFNASSTPTSIQGVTIRTESAPDLVRCPLGNLPLV